MNEWASQGGSEFHSRWILEHAVEGSGMIALVENWDSGTMMRVIHTTNHMWLYHHNKVTPVPANWCTL